MPLLLENLLDLSLDAAPWLVLGLIIGGLIKAWIPADFLQHHLSGHGLVPIVKAALFGAPLPLCSCGVIPVALGLRRAGASKASTVSFLVSTPETGVDSVSISYALLGPFMAIVRPVAAIASALTAGLLVGRQTESTSGILPDKEPETASCCASNNEKEVARPEKTESCCGNDKTESAHSATASCITRDNVVTSSIVRDKKRAPETHCCDTAEANNATRKTDTYSTKNTLQENNNTCCTTESAIESNATCCSTESTGDTSGKTGLFAKAWRGIHYSFTDLLDNVFMWLVVGLVFAALIKTFVPASFLAEWGIGLPAMLIMLVVGIPMYVCATASTPIAAGLILAGVSPGTALVFLMAGPATNISTLGVIGKELGRRSLLAYLTGVGSIALLSGYLVDYGIKHWNINVQAQLSASHDMVPAFISWGSLLLLLAVAIRIKSRVLLSQSISAQAESIR